MGKKYAIGVDLGGTNIRAALQTLDGNIVEKLKEPTGKDPLLVLFRLLDALYTSHAEEVCGIGIAVAGLVDRDNGVILVSPNIPVLDGVRLKEEVERRYGIPVVLENDANAAAFGEKVSGAGRDYRNFVLLTLGTGVGCGVVVQDKLLPVAAELGHMSINLDGPQCPCGNVGCLELYASATAIIGKAVAGVEKGGDSILKGFHNGNLYKITAEDIYKAALEGDPLSRTILRDAGKGLGVGIAGIINIFSPSAVILAGGLIGAWNIYIDAAVKEASKRALKELYGKVSIIRSSLGDDAGITGVTHLMIALCKA